MGEQGAAAELPAAAKPPHSGALCPLGSKCKEECSVSVQRTEVQPSARAGAGAECAPDQQQPRAKDIFSCREILNRNLGRGLHDRENPRGSTSLKTSN